MEERLTFKKCNLFIMVYRTMRNNLRLKVKKKKKLKRISKTQRKLVKENVRGAFNKFPDFFFFLLAFKIIVDS